jgi:CheY-like chemotaxis protein
MGGSIHIDSAPKLGTTIDVSLPFAIEDVELPKPFASNVLDQLQVLLVDESQTSRNNSEIMLKSFGYEVNTFTNFEDVRSYLLTDAPVDLVILHWNISTQNGEEALLQLSNARKLPPRFVYVTPFGQESVPTELRRQIDAYLPKPYTAPMLFDVIASVFITQPVKTVTEQNGECLFSNYRFLLIDDNPVNNLIARSMLEQEGALVTTLQSASKALEHLTDHKYHLIISDIDMPVMNGFEFLDAFRKTDQSTPVFALTANTGDENRQQIQIAGFDFYISKPLTQQKLKQIAEFIKTHNIMLEPINPTVKKALTIAAVSKEINELVDSVEIEHLLIGLESLLNETKLRKPKGCKERLQVLRLQVPACTLFLQLLDQLQSDLSRYRFEQMITALETLIVDLGGERVNESS